MKKQIFNYYGARYYDPRTSIWLSTDPMQEKYPAIGTYVYTASNPIKYIDPDGKKVLNFDKDGNYTGITKDNWWHNFWFGIQGRIQNDDGSSETFRFVDPKNDANQIINGAITKLYRVSDDDIIKLMSRGGVFTKENKTKNNPMSKRYDYINEHSIGGEKLDFSATQIFAVYPAATIQNIGGEFYGNSIFLIMGYAHNHMNFGNFLWGAAGEALGLTEVELRAGAHYNSLFNSGSNGYKPQLDSDDDQLSIRLGFTYGAYHKYHNMEYKVEVGPLSAGKFIK